MAIEATVLMAGRLYLRVSSGRHIRTVDICRCGHACAVEEAHSQCCSCLRTNVQCSYCKLRASFSKQ